MIDANLAHLTTKRKQARTAPKTSTHERLRLDENRKKKLDLGAGYDSESILLEENISHTTTVHHCTNGS
jgi:hypothetical protein